MSEPYGVASDFDRLPMDGHCAIRACAFPGFGFRFYDLWTGVTRTDFLCGFHFIAGASPFSLEYMDADALLGVPKHKNRTFDKDSTILQKEDSWWNTFEKHASYGGYFGTPRTRRTRSRQGVFQNIEHTTRKPSIAALSATHALDYIYTGLGLTGIHGDLFAQMQMVYSRCGERIDKQSVATGTDQPTCETCLRILAAHNREVEPLPIRTAIKVPIFKPRTITESASCTGKRRHDSFETAELAASLLIEAGEAVHAYQCGYCKLWHVGHDTKKLRGFVTRRNWGDARNDQWADPSMGVQKHMQKHSQSRGQKRGTNKGEKASSR